VRDFFNSMVNTGTDLAEVKRFISDWRILTTQRTVTDPPRWDELVAAYHAAQHALNAQVATWIADARARMAEIDSGLDTRVREIGVPADKVAEETANVAALFAEVRSRLAGDHFDYGRAVGVRSALTGAEMGLKPKLAEIRNRYKVTPSVTETHLRWQDIAHPDRISSADDLDRLLTSLRQRIEAELNQQRTVILE
jgi:hypothetical protein